MRDIAARGSFALRGLLCAFVALILSASAADSADLSVASEFFASKATVTLEQPQGNPPATAVRGPDGTLLGYAFSTYEVSGSVGYAGRPLDIVAAVTTEGIIAGARIVAHEEPILVIGIPRDALAAYVRNFAGFDTRVGAALKPADDLARGPHAVAGATITSTVIRDAILRSARAVLRSRSASTGTAARLDRETLRWSSWYTLLAEGAVQRKLVTRGEAAKMLDTQDSEPDKSFMDLWLALATPPPIGESLLGQRIYESELARIGPDDDLILIGASGLYSFKGTDWRQSGTFNRIELIQGGKTFRLKAVDHTPVEALRAAGAPELREIAVFRIAKTSGFDSTKPFRLDLDLGTPAAGGGPAVVSLEYRVPERYLIAPPAPPAAAPPGKAQAASASSQTLWQDIWWARRFEIAVLGVMLVVLAGILVFQDTVTAHGIFYYRLRTGYLLLTLIFLGFIANAQLSVVNVLTFIHALLSGFRWELFLLDPLVFLLWSFVAVSMLFWGRGVFCGWLCPFGTLQELTNQLAQRLGIKQVEVPFGLHERLWMIKYVAFVGILAVSLRSILGAFQLAEIEPFKTAITMKFMREWPFVIYAGLLLLAGLFVERFYCRYLCPLGAALAIPARMRMFEWLKRYRECGSECHVCARTCTVQAIHPLGQINPNECIYCLKCQANVQALWEAHVDWFSAAPGAETPPEKLIARARMAVDWRKITIKPESIGLGPAQRLTLNGLGQGYVTDRIAGLFASRGLKHVLVDLGEQQAIDARLDGKPWQIARADKPPIRLRSGALATSEGAGCVLGAGGAAHHLFDPRSGRSAAHWKTVTVHHRSAAVADALSTTFYIASAGEIAALLPRFPGTVVWARDHANVDRRWIAAPVDGVVLQEVWRKPGQAPVTWSCPQRRIA